MNLTVYPYHGPGSIPGHGGVFQQTAETVVKSGVSPLEKWLQSHDDHGMLMDQATWSTVNTTKSVLEVVIRTGG